MTGVYVCVFVICLCMQFIVSVCCCVACCINLSVKYIHPTSRREVKRKVWIYVSSTFNDYYDVADGIKM